MSIVWPVSLPAKPLVEGWDETPRSNVIRSKPDIGADKLRRRYTGQIKDMKGQMIMTDTQRTTFFTFFHTTLADGSLSYKWTHPITGETIEVRFTAPYSYKQVGPDAFKFQFVWETLP